MTNTPPNMSQAVDSASSKEAAKRGTTVLGNRALLTTPIVVRHQVCLGKDAARECARIQSGIPEDRETLRLPLSLLDGLLVFDSRPHDGPEGIVESFAHVSSNRFKIPRTKSRRQKLAQCLNPPHSHLQGNAIGFAGRNDTHPGEFRELVGRRQCERQTGRKTQAAYFISARSLDQFENASSVGRRSEHEIF